MLVFLSVIENIVVLCPSFLLFSATRTQFYSQLKRAVESRKNFIMPGQYKKIMPAQQPIRARVILQPYNKRENNAAQQPIRARVLLQPYNKAAYYPHCYLLVGAYRRLKTKENFKLLALKVAAVAYEGWSLTRGSQCSDLAKKRLVFWKSGR